MSDNPINLFSPVSGMLSQTLQAHKIWFSNFKYDLVHNCSVWLYVCVLQACSWNILYVLVQVINVTGSSLTEQELAGYAGLCGCLFVWAKLH